MNEVIHSSSDEEQFNEYMQDIKFVMLTTLDQNRSFINSRPMTILENDSDGHIWFFAAHSSDVARQIENYALVNLTFSHPKDFSFLSAQGFAEVSDDKSKKEMLWNPKYKEWFTGVDDPDLCLIKVVVKSVDYWKSPDSSLVRLMNFTRSTLTGKKSQTPSARHEHLNLNKQ